MRTNHQAQDDQSATRLLIRPARPASTELEAFAALEKPALFGTFLVLLGVSYYLAVKLGMRFRFQSPQIGAVWPANAILLSALLLAPRTRWWLVLGVTGLAHVATMGPTMPV